MKQIKYIGTVSPWVDTLGGSGLTWTTNQVATVSDDVCAELIGYPALFVFVADASGTITGMQAAFDAGTPAQQAQFQASVSKAARLRVKTADWGSGVVVNGVVMTQFVVPSDGYVNQVLLNWTITSAGTYYEVSIYSAAGAQIVSSGTREHPVSTGITRVALPNTLLPAGQYWVVLSSNSATAAVAMSSVSADNLSRTAALVLPLGASLPTSSTYSANSLACIIENADLPAPVSIPTVTTGTVRVYGYNASSSQPWGWNTLTGRLCYSATSGATWVDAMLYPPLTVGAPLDILINGTTLYLLTTEMEVWQTSDLSSTATWTNISVPVATGWRRSIAKGRPYSFIIWNDWLFCGEYTSGVDMNTDPNWINDQAGPRLFRYGPLSGTPTWVVSKTFNSARHIHSLSSPGSAILWVSLGDLGQWTNGQKTGTIGISADVGIHRLTAITAGGPDGWLDWTGNTAPITTHYPVDFLQIAGRSDAPDGLYGAADSVGKHLLYTRTSGNVGAFNISPQAFRKNSDPGETCRSLTYDSATGNMYWWTVETADPGIYVSPPPYTQSYRIYSGPMTAAQCRAVISGNYILQFDQRFSLVKFPWQ